MLTGVQKYLRDRVDGFVTIKRWKDENKLPLFLKNHYAFYETDILDCPCLIAEVIDDGLRIPNLEKHLGIIAEATTREVILLFKNTTDSRRKSLIENRIPFLIDDGQMYLPFLGLDLKNETRQTKPRASAFSPSAQVIYLYFLYHQNVSMNTTECAERFGFSMMTASRALNDLYDAKLLTYMQGGQTQRSKTYHRIDDGKTYLSKGMEMVKSPVKEVRLVKDAPEGTYVSGMQALAEFSMLNEPAEQIRATDEKRFKQIAKEIVEVDEFIENGSCVKLEVWKYDPGLYARGNYVDRMSLYASLKDDPDERVQQALEEKMKGEKWYTD